MGGGALQGAADGPPAVSVHDAAGVHVLVEPDLPVLPVKPAHVAAQVDALEGAGGGAGGHLGVDVTAAL